MFPMASQKKVDINTAKLEDFELLVGVGHAKAVNIIEHRRSHGPFCSITDLRQIPGIGPSILELNRGLLTCTANAANTPKTPKTCERELRRSARSEGYVDDSAVAGPSGLAPNTPATRSRSMGLLDSRPPTRGSARTTSVIAMATPETSTDPSSCCSPSSSSSSSSSLHAPQQTPRRIKNHHHMDSSSSNACSSSNAITNSVLNSASVVKQNHLNLAADELKEEQDETEEEEEEEEQELNEDDEDNANNNIEEEEDINDEEDEEEEDDMPVESGEIEGMEYSDCCNEASESGISEGVLASLRSRAAMQLAEKEKQALMKRKCESGASNKDMSPGKKPCRLSEENMSSACSDDPGSPGSQQQHEPCLNCLHCSHCGQNTQAPNTPPSAAATSIAMLRKRIPSKTNPPPELANWIKTFQDWSHPERLLALDELIERCQVPEVRHMMTVIEPQFQRDFISLLPKELALHVLSYLKPRDLCRAAQTCRYWRILASDNLLWREKCKEEAITEQAVFENQVRKRNLSCNKNPWKGLYLRQKEIEHRWGVAPIRDPKVLKGHDDHVITCLEFCGTRIVSGSDDNTLKVWSAVTGTCLRTLVGHTGGVWSSQMAGHIIISGSTDRTLRVWHADTGQCIHVLYGHTSTVRCMCLYKNKVVSGSRDATLRMWDIDTGQCLHVLMGHVAAVRCVQYDGKRVVSGAYDYMVKIWDPETETCLHTLQGHTNRVYSLQFDGTHIVSGSLDTSIRVWDVETGQSLHTLIGHQSLTSGMELKDSILVSGNADSTVKVWDIRTGHCLQTLQGPNKHQSAVTCLQFNKKFAITSSDDGTVKIWSVRTGEFLRDLVKLESGGSGGVVWRIRCSNTKLVCAVGSRNGTEETKLLVLDFDVDEKDNVTVNRNGGTKDCGGKGGSSENLSSSSPGCTGSSSASRRLSLGASGS